MNQLRHLHEHFDGFGSSAMTKSVGSKVTVGRPFGGTGFVYHKKYSKCLRPMLTYEHDRISVMELSTVSGKILLINVYFPFYNTRDLTNYTNMYKETIGFIDHIMHTNQDCSFIMTADFNCNIYDTNHTYSKLVRSLMEKYNLVSCFDHVANFDFDTSFTRYDVKTKSYTLIDGILISQDLIPLVDNIRISHYGNNLSDHIPVEIDLHVKVNEYSLKKPSIPRYVNWSRLTDEQKGLFREKMSEELASLNLQSDLLVHGEKCCLDDSHKLILEQYYCDIQTAVIRAESCLPKTNPNIQRSFWNDELESLKTDSLDCHNHWKNSGSPRSGVIFECKNNCYYRYKSALRKAKAAEEKRKSDGLYSNLLDKNKVSFWKQWNSINRIGSSVTSRINGETEDGKIADTFADYFCSVYGNNDTPKHLDLARRFRDLYGDYYDTHINDSLSNSYLSWSEMVDIARKIEIGKATSGVIKPEHFLYGCPELLTHFHILFNGMIQHSFVPTDFLMGTVSPIVKDTQGDVSRTSNYRGITLSVLPAKLFEFAIQKKTAHLLGTDELQFGFKRKTSTANALYALKTTVDHFTERGSKVFVAFLDCSKAFDRISHCGLFSKLIECKLPLCFLLCLIFWYSNMISVAKWGTENSQPFPVPLGIKQGGINSPDYFAVYFDGLSKVLRQKGLGCYVYGIFLAMILFADDICLMAPTRSALVGLISAVTEYCNEYCLSFNPKKSKIMIFSKKKVDLKSLCSVDLAGIPIDYVQSIRYLGTTIVSAPAFAFSCSDELRNFYRAANAILNTLKKPKEEVLMHLLFTNCVPILTYASSVKYFSAKEMRDCNTALNDSIRKIFGFNRWESVRFLRESFGYKSLYDMFAKAARCFQISLGTHHNSVLKHLSKHC